MTEGLDISKDVDEFGVPYWEKYGLIELDANYKWEDAENTINEDSTSNDIS